MPDEPEQPDRAWLLEPVGPNEVRLHVDVGEGAEISEEAREALDAFVDELQAGEVQGFATFPSCPSLDACGSPGYKCRLGKCQPLTKDPCFADVACTIQKLV